MPEAYIYDHVRTPRGRGKSDGALHEVTPIARGRRYAFLPFLYGEADAALRAANNARLDESSAQYQVGDDLLYPPAATSSDVRAA